MVASLLAAGYTVGTDTLTKAKDYDGNFYSFKVSVIFEKINLFLYIWKDKHLITLSLQNGAAAVKGLILFFFKNLFILTKSFLFLIQTILARALAIDEQYKVSENFQAATTRLQQAVNQVISKRKIEIF